MSIYRHTYNFNQRKGEKLAQKNYVSNNDILREIHLSKMTYCYIEDEKYRDYDLIADDYTLITYNDVNTFFEENPDRDYVIIRVMTTEHIAEFIEGKKVNLQTFKFAPFKHFTLTRKVHKKFKPNSKNNTNVENLVQMIADNKKVIRDLKAEKRSQKTIDLKFDASSIKEKIDALKQENQDHIEQIKFYAREYSDFIKKHLIEVVRSHWTHNALEKGHFTIDEGNITLNLSTMMLRMINEIGKKPQWVKYTYLEDMKSSAFVHLYDVCLKFDEARSSMAFSYFTANIINSFLEMLNKEKQEREINNMVLIQAGYKPSFAWGAEEEYQNMLDEYYKGVE